MSSDTESYVLGIDDLLSIPRSLPPQASAEIEMYQLIEVSDI
jgi:hypothetical protein